MTNDDMLQLATVVCSWAFFIWVANLQERIEKLERHVHSADELLNTTNGPQEPPEKLC